MANFDITKAMFSQIDTNKDGSIDPKEFRRWVPGSITNAASPSSYESFTSGLAASTDQAVSSKGKNSAYQTSFNAQNDLQSSDTIAVGGMNNAYQSSVALAENELLQTSGVSFESNSAQQNIQYSATNGLFNDPNPQIIRRAATENAVTYKQKILVKFLQPPPVPPPGPLIIKEIRPPQPPPPLPLILRQRAPPLPQPPPLILRERPPVPPASIATQTIIRRLPPVPVPPRSVITERLPPLPPKPRDIIIERWVPYPAQGKRQTIIQRAAPAKEYPAPRNIVIVYDPVSVRVVRQFERFGVTQEDPQAYLTRYGDTLLDSASLVQQARAAGIIEDISPPAAISTQFNTSTNGIETDFGYSTSSTRRVSSFEDFQVNGDGERAYSSSSFTTEGDHANGARFDIAAVSFAAADTNKDGTLDKIEFERFIQDGISK